MNRTAIFGGKFDPPHLAHQLVVFLLLEHYKFDEVWILPSYLHPLKREVTPFSLRMEMAELLISPWEGDDRVHVYDYEKLFFEETKGYTYNLLRKLASLHSNRRFSLALGSDNVKISSRWYRFEDIVEEFGVVVIGRGAAPDSSFFLPDISSSLIRRLLREGKDVRRLLSPEVYDFIKERRLYG